MVKIKIEIYTSKVPVLSMGVLNCGFEDDDGLHSWASWFSMGAFLNNGFEDDVGLHGSLWVSF
jgi:hypothetical protein